MGVTKIARLHDSEVVAKTYTRVVGCSNRNRFSSKAVLEPAQNWRVCSAVV